MSWHRERGALFEQFGNWFRPAAYPLPGETLESAAQREAGAVRSSAGVLDGSPLGKLEIFGPDAAKFLDLMYVGTMSTLELGQARYGVLLNENGIPWTMVSSRAWARAITGSTPRAPAPNEPPRLSKSGCSASTRSSEC